jgi:hypothetical protein
MSQPVGLKCALCNGRIASEFEGEFCATCGNPIHMRCAAPSVARMGVCEVCGADATAGAAHRQRSREEATGHTRHALYYRALSGVFFLIVGGALLAVGFASLVQAVEEAEISTVLVGIIILGASLAAVGLAQFRAIWRVRPDAKRERAEVEGVDLFDAER